jgi:hypothetical protein
MRRPFVLQSVLILPITSLVLAVAPLVHAAPAAPTPQEREKALTDLQQAYEQLEAVARTVPRDTILDRQWEMFARGAWL